ncbi:hypothetical protein [Alteribacter natronophilus]|uniref:hypothetical protein n=1 Tax=Alteribacter natronophilus TaxID=2583810 RepID=UPI00110D3D8E|nr:hypothetical protein [Alteribacter natronophilus]TMW71199.1 hypothetical protein FGB90_14680 [Alteribacter natronophilus]
MIKQIAFTGFVSMYLLVISSCSTGDFNYKADDVDRIHVSEFERFGSIDGEDPLTITQEDELNIILTAINSSQRIDGSVDMAEGDYDFEIILHDESPHGFHFWLPAENTTGTIMNVNDTETIYDLTEESSRELTELLFD